MDRNDYDLQYQESREHSHVEDTQVAVYLAKVMGWMCLGLLTTLTFAIVTLVTPALRSIIFNSGYGYLGVIVLQLVIAFAFGGLLPKMNAAAATVCFLLYSALTGMTFSVLFLVFELPSLVFVFGLTALTFFLLAIYGFVTKKDLTKIGTLALFGLLGIIIVNLANMFFLKSSALDLAICCIGIVIFIALIAYDTQKIKGFYIGAMSAGYDDESQEVRKFAIYGAFALYLDFINLFLKLLRILGKRR